MLGLMSRGDGNQVVLFFCTILVEPLKFYLFVASDLAAVCPGYMMGISSLLLRSFDYSCDL